MAAFTNYFTLLLSLCWAQFLLCFFLSFFSSNNLVKPTWEMYIIMVGRYWRMIREHKSPWFTYSRLLTYGIGEIWTTLTCHSLVQVQVPTESFTLSCDSTGMDQPTVLILWPPLQMKIEIASLRQKQLRLLPKLCWIMTNSSKHYACA